MVLIACIGNRKECDENVVSWAIEQRPSLIIDAANCADPHRFHGRYPAEVFCDVHAIQVDLLYTLRDLLRSVPQHCTRIGTRIIVITSCDGLFTYHDEEENQDLRLQVWELLVRIARQYDIVVSVGKNSPHAALARRFATVKEGMPLGHTVLSQRQLVDSVLRELREYARALSQEDRVLFERAMQYPLKHLGAITYTSSLHAWAFVLLSAIVEQQRQLERRCG